MMVLQRFVVAAPGPIGSYAYWDGTHYGMDEQDPHLVVGAARAL